MKSGIFFLVLLLALGGCSSMKWNADPEKVDQLGCYKNSTGDDVCPGHQ